MLHKRQIAFISAIWLQAASCMIFVKLNIDSQPCGGSGVVAPFHAVVQDKDQSTETCTWKCERGYFATKTSFSAKANTISVCKPCSKRIECPVGFTQGECSSFQDSTCVPCRTLDNFGEMYTVPGDCNQKGCREGYILLVDLPSNETSARCAACPADHFCALNEMVKCPENCTTNGQTGSSKPFACTPQGPNVGMEIVLAAQMTIIISAHSSSNPSEFKGYSTECDPLNKVINAWMEHGILQECSIELVSASHAIATCFISVSPCIAAYFTSWLLSRFGESKYSVLQSIFQCLQLDSINQLSVGNPIIQTQQSQKAQKNRDLIQRTIPPPDPPQLVIEPQRWFLDRDQTLLSVGLFYVLILAMVLSLILMCALWYLKSRRNAVVDSLYNKLMGMRRDAVV